MNDPLDPMRMEGIRLHHSMGACTPDMVTDLLEEIARMRQVEQGLRTELSVHERRVRVSKLSMFTEAEEAMLVMSVDLGYQLMLNRPGEFSEADHKAMKYLKETIAP